MKILWVKTDFLHPTTRGGQIRTLETLKYLRGRHEVHYVAFADPQYPEAVARSMEYCSVTYPVQHRVASKRSLRFGLELLQGLVSPLPVAIARYRSGAMRETINGLLAQHSFDSIVCDFLAPAPNLPDLAQCVLFQHNVEAMIWQRHAQHAANPLARAYFRLQAKRMLEYERAVCNAARYVIAVSDADAQTMRKHYGTTRIAAVPTGVDVHYFHPDDAAPAVADLVFVGSMDWLPNIDAVRYFAAEILPLIRRQRADTKVAIVGRSPGPEIQALAADDPLIQVTGTVSDVRPYLWGAKVSIVPIRIGGGTRLKIYEAMAAGVPVVSTSVGAEGLEIHPPTDILIGDDPASFASHCLQLMEDRQLASRMAAAARQLVVTRFSWEQVGRQFEAILESCALTSPVARDPQIR